MPSDAADASLPALLSRLGLHKYADSLSDVALEGLVQILDSRGRVALLDALKERGVLRLVRRNRPCSACRGSIIPTDTRG